MHFPRHRLPRPPRTGTCAILGSALHVVAPGLGPTGLRRVSHLHAPRGYCQLHPSLSPTFSRWSCHNTYRVAVHYLFTSHACLQFLRCTPYPPLDFRLPHPSLHLLTSLPARTGFPWFYRSRILSVFRHLLIVFSSVLWACRRAGAFPTPAVPAASHPYLSLLLPFLYASQLTLATPYRSLRGHLFHSPPIGMCVSGPCPNRERTCAH